MPRSASPCDTMPTAISTAKFMVNGIDERDGSDGGGSCSGGGGVSSSCSSDEDDGGECSRDSSRSEVHDSPIERGMISTPPPLNGIEVKPCHIISTVTSGIRRREPTDQEIKSTNSCKQFLDCLSQRNSPPISQDADSGGTLRFYLDGSCVLELKHDMDDEGRPKQWVQSWGKIFNPPPPSLPPPPPPLPPPQAWHPQELPSQDSQDEGTASPLSSVTAPCSKNKNKKKYLNSQSLTFFLRRRHPSSHHVKKLQFPSCCVLRRVARNPGHIAINKNISCTNGGVLCSCQKKKFKSLSSATSVEKSYNLISIVRKLSQVHDENKTNEDADKSHQTSSVHDTSGPDTSLLASTSLLSSSPLSSSTTVPSSTSSSPPLQSHLLSESLSKNLDCCPVPHLNSEYDLKESESVRKNPEKLENAASRPLPEWYFDPSKASIPVIEMIGYPRPSLLKNVQKISINKRKVADEIPGKSSLDPPPVVSKKPKDDNKVVFDGDNHSSSLIRESLHTTSKSPLSMKCNPNPFTAVRVCADKKSTSVSDEVSSVKERNSHFVNSNRDSKNDQAQKKRKRGGYGRGRTIGEAVRAFVIGDILNLGGDVRTKYVPRGVFTEVASRYKIDATTTYRWWLKYCNGVRMAASGQQESSQKPFLPSCLTNLSSSDMTTFGVSDPKAFVNDLYRKPDKKHHNPTIMVGKQHTTPISFDKFSSKENGRYSLGGSHSPRSDDSMSSGASMLDASSLNLSSVSIGPPNGTWNPSLALPFFSNGHLPPPSSGMPLPVGICLPYLWNYPSTPAITNGHSNTNYDSHFSEEPLDLTLPKQRDKTNEQGDIGKGSSLSKPQDRCCVGDPCTYSECNSSDQLILKTLLSVREQQAATTKLQDIIRHHKSNQLTKGIVSQPTQAQPNLKPKHYPFVSLQIGTFEIHSSFSPNCSDKDYLKENPNKFKVIFTQRKFVYEFETSTKMLMPQTDEQACRSRQMACIVVPFSIVEAFWCYGTTIILQVVSKPLMFLGQRLKQVGCVPSLTVYETKKSVDLTGGQLHIAPLHQVILLKPHLVEQLKIYLILFDIRFRNLMAPAVLPVVKQSIESNDDQTS